MKHSHYKRSRLHNAHSLVWVDLHHTIALQNVSLLGSFQYIFAFPEHIMRFTGSLSKHSNQSESTSWNLTLPSLWIPDSKRHKITSLPATSTRFSKTSYTYSLYRTILSFCPPLRINKPLGEPSTVYFSIAAFWGQFSQVFLGFRPLCTTIKLLPRTLETDRSFTSIS